jgi:hypothetical protein
MIRRSCLIALLFGLVSAPVLAATDYTDTWWDSNEAGWGVTLTQQANFIFVTFYVYAPDGRPTWYTAYLTRDGTAERFSGGVHRSQGTWFGAPWAGSSIAQVGTATFSADSSTSGTLDYSVDGVTVIKFIERTPLVPLNLAGLYIGGVSGRRSGCPASGAIIETMHFDVLHATVSGDVRIDQVSAATGALVCRMEGKAVQSGKVFSIDGANYTCIDGWSAIARVFNLRPTPAGFEGQWFSDAGNGCTEDGQFSGVTRTP